MSQLQQNIESSLDYPSNTQVGTTIVHHHEKCDLQRKIQQT